jgi:hypothetical protein
LNVIWSINQRSIISEQALTLKHRAAPGGTIAAAAGASFRKLLPAAPSQVLLRDEQSQRLNGKQV